MEIKDKVNEFLKKQEFCTKRLGEIFEEEKKITCEIRELKKGKLKLKKENEYLVKKLVLTNEKYQLIIDCYLEFHSCVEELNKFRTNAKS